MESNLEAALESEGWIVECESPLEIRREDDPESFASGHAAQLIIDQVHKQLKRSEKKKLKTKVLDV
jgi:hypothetical protein